VTVEVSRFLIPIEGLTVLTDWKVGPVVVGPAAVVANGARQGLALSNVEWFDKVVAEQGSGTLASVEAGDLDAAIDLVAQAVDVLRVFQHVRHFTSELAQFGIAGDVGRGVVPYIQTDRGQAGRGSSHRGNHLGWTFSNPDEWTNAPVFQWAARAIDASSHAESQRRALVGIQLLSQALVERRATFKMVELVGTLEAWLLPRQAAGQTFRLARAVAFFGCGRHNGDLCGRSRDTCPYLELNPDKTSERSRLKQLRVKGAHPPWRCAEWHRVVDWYDHRSDVVHGSGPVISYKDASNALYWVCRYLAEPILQWLADHPTAPVTALEAEIAALPPAPDWEARLGNQI
jgi:ribosome modulation factor